MSKEIVYLLAFDGFADWEAAFVTPEIRKRDRLEVKTVGFTKEPVTSMGGLSVTPDGMLEQATPDEAALLILPSGDRWETDEDDACSRLLRRWHAASAPLPSQPFVHECSGACVDCRVISSTGRISS